MNILIVDDDTYVLELVCRKMKWQELGIDEVFTATSARRAKEIITGQTVDILLTDIEMPGESGLELLEWIRVQNIQLEALFLTSYAEFAYAKKAIELKSLEYYLKPVDEDALSKGIASAVMRCREYKKILASHTNLMEEHFWLDVTNGLFEKEPDKITDRILKDGLNFTGEHHFVVVCFRFLPVLNRNIDEYLHSYEGKINKIFKSFYQDTYYEIVYSFTKNEGRFGYYLKLNQKICNLIDIHNTTCKFVEYIEKQEKLEIYGAVGEITSLAGIYGQYVRLMELLYGIIETDDRVLSSGQKESREKISYNMPDLEMWESVFLNGNQEVLSAMIVDYLRKLVEKKQINTFVLKMFCMDVEQLVYRYLRKRHVEMYKLFGSEEAKKLSRLAVQSIECMKQYADYLIAKSMEYVADVEETESIVNRLKDYLDDHYCDSVSRSDLADLVYLNPDYLSRLFKKEMNMSINAYLIDKRLEKAKALLVHSDLPVHMVSMEVGYNNFSYFTKLFREKTGQTPNDYRKAFCHSEQEP